MPEEKLTVRQIIAQVDEILKDNPVPAGEESRAVKLVDDDAISIIVNCMLEGAELKHHFHKTHAETEVFLRGTGQLLVARPMGGDQGRQPSLQPRQRHTRHTQYRGGAPGCPRRLYPGDEGDRPSFHGIGGPRSSSPQGVTPGTISTRAFRIG